jgi:bifunctional non-homologous end joining protein LigD
VITWSLPSPMLATPVEELPRAGDAWAYEMKWDGYRAIVEVRDGQLRIVSRRGNDMTARYPELAGLAEAVGGLDAVLDGEVVVLDDGGRPSFQAIQQHEAPAVLIVFDLLELDGHELTGFPWSERRALLERLGLHGERWQISPAVVGDADRVRAAAEELGMEGVMAKRVDSPYRPGTRSREWRKVRFSKRQELVIGGWLPGEGRLSGTIGALLVGYQAGPAGPLRYAGRVGSGLTDALRAELLGRFAPRDASPFTNPPRVPDVVWVEPDVVAEVRFSEWTSDDVLRQPVFLGLRDDKDPADVVRET